MVIQESGLLHNLAEALNQGPRRYLHLSQEEASLVQKVFVTASSAEELSPAGLANLSLTKEIREAIAAAAGKTSQKQTLRNTVQAQSRNQNIST